MLHGNPSVAAARSHASSVQVGLVHVCGPAPVLFLITPFSPFFFHQPRKHKQVIESDHEADDDARSSDDDYDSELSGDELIGDDDYGGAPSAPPPSRAARTATEDLQAALARIRQLEKELQAAKRTPARLLLPTSPESSTPTSREQAGESSSPSPQPPALRLTPLHRLRVNVSSGSLPLTLNAPLTSGQAVPRLWDAAGAHPAPALTTAAPAGIDASPQARAAALMARFEERRDYHDRNRPASGKMKRVSAIVRECGFDIPSSSWTAMAINIKAAAKVASIMDLITAPWLQLPEDTRALFRRHIAFQVRRCWSLLLYLVINLHLNKQVDDTVVGAREFRECLLADYVDNKYSGRKRRSTPESAMQARAVVKACRFNKVCFLLLSFLSLVSHHPWFFAASKIGDREAAADRATGSCCRFCRVQGRGVSSV
jgi:hypothetical protein